ncbi:MAG: apolipoprotein N-acyltransferase, partial [Betaproteobacteria bacterium]|nr:apolipoprotein N-acyltransferase [Betaproteobacteria bacterium]
MRPKPAAALALAFGVGWLCAGVWWLFVSMHRYGQLPAWLAAAAVSALSLALSTYLAVAGACYAAWRTGRPGVDAALFAALWTLAECARGVLWTGFPWVASGYAWVDAPWAALAPWVGVYGVGWLAAFVSALIADNIVGFSERKQVFWKNGLPLAMVLVLLIPWKFPTNSQSQSFSVSLMQANVPQDLKFTKLKEQSVEWFVHNAIEAKTDLVVMPETAIPYLRHEMPQKYWAQLENHFSNSPKALIVGIPTYEEGKGFGNSAIGIQGQQAEYIYHKHHLVPFGEFIPQYFRWFNEGVNFGMTDFIRGPVQPEPFSWMGQQLAIQICYEDLFGEELARRFTVSKDKLPTVLVNMSNIAW